MHKPILLDGPMGTEIERRGGDTSMPLWSARALLETPELIKTIHADFIQHGAQVITTNTFRTQERTLTKAGYKGKGEELSRLAVQLSNEAKKGKSVLIAGSIAPLEDCYSPQLVPSQEELRKEHGDMARWLYDEGIDMYLIETMNVTREAIAAVNAAKDYDLPIWLAFTCNDDGKILGGEGWNQIFDFALQNVDVLMVNCSTPEASYLAFQLLRAFKDRSGMKIGIYPNYLFDLEQGQKLEIIRNNYLRNLDDIMQMDPDVIGTCCGATLEDTKLLRRRLDQKAVD